MTRFVPTYQQGYPSDSAPYHSNPYQQCICSLRIVHREPARVQVAAEGDELYWANDSTASLDAGTVTSSPCAFDRLLPCHA